MRIAHFASGSWERGGVSSYLARILAGLRGRGHEVWLFDDRPPAKGEAAPDDVLFVSGPGDLAQALVARNIAVLHSHETFGGQRDFPVPLLRTVHGHRPYCPSHGKFLARTGLPCSRRASLPVCLLTHVTEHCGSLRPGRMIREFRQTARDNALLREIRLIAVSRYVKEELIRHGYREDLITVLPNPAPDCPPPNPGARDPGRFVFLGRIVPAKGLGWLLSAMRQLPASVTLDVAGEGYQQPAMQERAREYRIEDRVRFWGWRDEAGTRALLESATALVFPSLWQEPAGLAALEAAALGCAVVASSVGGLPEFAQEGRNAILVPPGDTSALAQALATLAASPQLAALLGAAGRRLATGSFSLASHLDGLERLYRQAIEPGSAGPAASEQ